MTTTHRPVDAENKHESQSCQAYSSLWVPLKMIGVDVSVRPWDVLIVDEGHQIKNPSSQSGRVLRRISARSRILLTGLGSREVEFGVQQCSRRFLTGAYEDPVAEQAQ